MFKSLLLKIIGRVASTLFFRKSKISAKVSANEIKTILVNRADRLGDAIISLPFLIELNKRFDVTVLTSKYNDFILREFLKTQIITDSALTTFEFLKIIFINFIRFNYPLRKNKSVPKYDLYIDLIGIRGLHIFLKIKKENLCRYYIGFNIAIWSLLLDYAYKGSVELTKTQMAEAYSRFVREGLGIDIDMPDYIDLSDRMENANLNIQSPYILINISGFDKFRGPSPKMYAQIINNLNFKGTIVILDELNQPNLEEFKKYLIKNNVFYLGKNYSIWQLLYISKGSILYIGSDSGITHILATPTNCVIIFGTGTPATWKPFSKTPYQRRSIGRLVVEETLNSVSLVKKIIYQPVWCRPCFDIGCRVYRCIRDMDIEAVSNEINLLCRQLLS